jgi:hypothetical protein
MCGMKPLKKSETFHGMGLNTYISSPQEWLIGGEQNNCWNFMQLFTEESIIRNNA